MTTGQDTVASAVFGYRWSHLLYIAVSTPMSAPGGTLVLTIEPGPPPPVNDELGAALRIGALPYTDTRDTSGATVGASSYCGEIGPSVWYVFAATRTERLQLTTDGSSYGAYMGALTGTPPNLTCLSNNYSQLPVDVVAGQMYYF